MPTEKSIGQCASEWATKAMAGPPVTDVECLVCVAFIAGGAEQHRRSTTDTIDPRPADMAELARLTAKELRSRGILATVDDTYRDHRIVGVPFSDMGQLRWFWYVLLSADFDNLGPVACADVIQAEERKRAQEWAGDDVE